jgi:hypothetical protein
MTLDPADAETLATVATIIANAGGHAVELQPRTLTATLRGTSEEAERRLDSLVEAGALIRTHRIEGAPTYRIAPAPRSA